MTDEHIFLFNHLAQEPQESYPCTSRIHELRTFPAAYVKRDDELGFSISGTKFRKYRTLVPFLCQGDCRQVVVIGGAFSNHVLGISQVLLENGVQPILFLKGSPPKEKIGNYAFLQMLVADPCIHWIPKNQWSEVEILAQEYASGEMNVKILPEGGTVFSAFLGALTLPLDILRNEREQGLSFDHIFFEVGTGYSAAALLLGLAYLKMKVHCHLLIMAETEETFRKQLKKLHQEFEAWLGQPCPFPADYTCSRPELAPSFGSTNVRLFAFIREIAQKEGFFLDPLYSAKLFHHARQKIQRGDLQGNTLIIHSGGGLSLSGFHHLMVSVPNAI